MSVGDSDILCRRWIIQYDCWRMWAEFSQEGTTADSVPYRRLGGASGEDIGSDLEEVDDCNSDGCRLLVTFMSKLLESAKEAAGDVNDESREEVSTSETNLEQAIDVLDRIANHFREVVDAADMRAVTLCLKRHAVLAPIRKGDRTTAKAVFGRQWLHWKNFEEMKMRDKLARITDLPTIPKQIPDFEEVITKSQRLLEKIMASMSQPFLVQVAQCVCKSLEAKNYSNVEQCQNLPVSVPRSPVKLAAQNNVPSSPTTKTRTVVVAERSRGKDQHRSDDAPQSAVRKSSGAAAAVSIDSSPERSKTLDVPLHKSPSSTPSRSKSSRADDKTSDDNSAASSPVKKSSRLSAVAASANSSPKRPKSLSESLQHHKSAANPSKSKSDKTDVDISDGESIDSFEISGDEAWHPKSKRQKKHLKKPWSSDEEELVYKGILMYGVGNWAKIHSNFLKYRTNVNIKDKWRTMTAHKGRMQELSRKFGSLPASK